MQKAIKYTIFKTKWGYFGLAGTELGPLRTCLPDCRFERVRSELLRNVVSAEYENGLFKVIQQQITAYFEGSYVNFNKDIPIVLEGLSLFASSVLAVCRDIKFGQTISYSELAEMLGRPGAARAIGNALAKNPLPLIIPCHRVVRSDGKVGGFSAPGGMNTKAKLLKHEQYVLIHSKND
jgi:methylated-DNA-[protein]-cysteine S-methyltransferase